MRINYNATAMLAVNALNRNDENVSVSTGKLSSGYKINRAKDNPSGYAMSRKMRAQLDGLMQARDNSDTGVNIIKAVDGALSEVHDMLQRMNELAIKGSTGTLSDGDRELVDEELQKLKEEVQRISDTFEFNGQKLLDGSFKLKGYVQDNLSVKVGSYNDRMKIGVYKFDLSGFQDGTPITRADGNVVRDLTLYDKSGNLIPENVCDLWRERVTVPADPSKKPANEGDPYTEPAILDPSGTQEGWGYIDPTMNQWVPLPEDWKETVEVPNPTNAANIVKVTGPDGKDIEPLYVSDASGTSVTLKGPDGFEIRLDIAEDFQDNLPNESDAAAALRKSAVMIDLTGLGAMTIQVGANEGQELTVEIPDVGLKGLGIDMIKTTTKEDSLEAITRVSVAINRLSSVRSKLGAYQNRLEAVVESNEINHENMTAAYSGILDTDMSEEYTKYSTYQILSQASTSVLAQANERPAQVLQLLQ